MPNIRGGQVKSMKKLKESLKKGGGSGAFIKNVPANDSMLVRFLTEPEEWFGYYEHYSQASKAYYPCVEDDCPGCQQDDRRSFRYLANAVDLGEDKVVPLKLAKTLATRLILKYDKYDTLMDRDYELSRWGEGLDTEYDADAEAPSKRNMKKYDLLDLGDVLDSAWENVFGGEEDDEDEPKAKKSKGKSKGKKASASKGKGKKRGGKAFVAEEEEDEDDWEDDEEEEDEDWEADEWEEEDEGWEDDEDEDEDEEDDEDWDEEDEDEEDEDEEWSEEDNWDRDELEAMSLGELKATAKEWGIPTSRKKKAELVDDLMDLNV